MEKVYEIKQHKTIYIVYDEYGNTATGITIEEAKKYLSLREVKFP